MKLTDHFDSFLAGTVNLNQTRVDQLTTSVSALEEAIRASDWKARIRSFISHGSWAHKTIIKPEKDKAFDADLLVLVDPVDGWDAKEYLASLRSVLASHGTYEGMVSRSSHCVTVTYAGERKVDIAPCVVARGGVDGYEVCNFTQNAFERSEPEKYTRWFVERSTWTGKNGLRKVTRLVKFLRNFKGTFTCASVLLTTLLGERVSAADETNAAEFNEVPTALRTLFGRLDSWLQVRPTKPTVRNPVLPTQIFSDLWSDDQYANFRDMVHTYREWIDDAFAEEDRDESIGKWRRVFGDDFASGAVTAKAASVTQEALVLLAKDSSVHLDARDDLVSLFSRLGLRALPFGFARLPHKQRATWTRAQTHFDVSVSASRHASQHGARIADIQSGAGPLAKGEWLKFSAHGPSGVGFAPSEYKIEWRVTNTDLEAGKANCLRGGFEPSNDGSSRWESLLYRGVHMVEAFVIRKRDSRLVGESAPFYVVIS